MRKRGELDIVWQEWIAICSKKGRSPSLAEYYQLDREMPQYSIVQLIWGMREYQNQTSYPHLDDFVQWLAVLDVPEDLACRAYLTGQPALIHLADELDNLLVAFFPSTETDLKIEAMRARLKRALED